MKVQKKFHKTLKNLNLSDMQPGQLLVNKNGEKRQIYFVNEFIVIFEAFAGKIQIIRKSMLENEGWSLLEEPWVPDYNEDYWYISSNGNILFQRRAIEDGSATDFRISVGNTHKTTKDAELYKQKLIERMGRKEN